MFRKQDFKKVDLLGNGKKNTKIYKVLHIASGRYYALKEVEAKSLDKLNEYKVSITTMPDKLTDLLFLYHRKKQCNCSRLRTTRTSSSFTATFSTRPCTIHTELASSAST